MIVLGLLRTVGDGFRYHNGEKFLMAIDHLASRCGSGTMLCLFSLVGIVVVVRLSVCVAEGLVRERHHHVSLELVMCSRNFLVS